MGENQETGAWGVKENYQAEVVEIIRETAQLVFYRQAWGSHTSEDRGQKSNFAAIGLTRAQAEKLAAKLISAKAERNRREAAARAWWSKEREKIITSAMSAGPAETGTGSGPQDRQRDPQGDAPTHWQRIIAPPSLDLTKVGEGR